MSTVETQYEHVYTRIGIVWLDVVGAISGLGVAIGVYQAMDSSGLIARVLVAGISGVCAATLWFVIAAILALLLEIAET